MVNIFLWIVKSSEITVSSSQDGQAATSSRKGAVSVMDTSNSASQDAIFELEVGSTDHSIARHLQTYCEIITTSLLELLRS